MNSDTKQLDLRYHSLTVEEAGLSELVDRLPDVYCEQGKVIFQSGSVTENICIQMSGRSIIEAANSPDQLLCSCPVESPRIYGIMEALAGVSYGCTLRAASPSRFRLIETDKMFAFLKGNAGSAYQLSRAIGRHYMEMVRNLS